MVLDHFWAGNRVNGVIGEHRAGRAGVKNHGFSQAEFDPAVHQEREKRVRILSLGKRKQGGGGGGVCYQV